MTAPVLIMPAQEIIAVGTRPRCNRCSAATGTEVYDRREMAMMIKGKSYAELISAIRRWRRLCSGWRIVGTSLAPSWRGFDLSNLSIDVAAVAIFSNPRSQ